jgi:hypothetical protein
VVTYKRYRNRHEKHMAMTPENPGFAAAVRVARRALAERIAARAADRKTPMDTNAVAPVPTGVPPVPGK